MTAPRPLYKQILFELTPPLVWNAARALRAALTPAEKAREREEGYYDRLFAATEEYRKHYTESCYYPFWCVIADRMMRCGVRSVLEIGCGPGQLAALLYDKGCRQYWGVDMSRTAIDMAEATCPSFTFVCQSAFDTDLLETAAYDALVTTEFLEHVENDLEIVARIRPKTMVFGSVPNFPFPSHVRHFAGAEDVRARYGRFFIDLQVEPFAADQQGKTFFIFQGVRA